MENKIALDRRTFVAGSAVAAATVGLGLYGCGGGETATTTEGGEGAAVEGGALTGACAYTSTNCNPIGNSSALMLAATWHVFEGLYDLDLHTYKTYNALAADKPVKVSDVEYEVTLREGAEVLRRHRCHVRRRGQRLREEHGRRHLRRIPRIHRVCLRQG